MPLIASVRATPLDIPLLAPFGIAGGAQDVARNVLVEIVLEDGTRGWGEAAPFPAFNGETQGAAIVAIEAVAPSLVGLDVHAWRTVASILRAQIPRVGAARCAIETAVLDALTRTAKLPLWAFFGGAGRELATDMTITTGGAGDARKAAEAMAREGFRTIKVKVGGGELARDVERIAAIRDAAPSAELVLDANAGLSVDDAIALVDAARGLGAKIALFEQPVRAGDLDGLRRVGDRGVLVAADESVASPADALRIAERRAADVLNVKLMKTGIVDALAIAEIARAAGLGLMIGGMVESILAMTTSACFAAGIGGFAFVDLDTPLFLAENPFRGGFAQRGPRLDLSSIEAGHGVVPK